MDTVIVMLFLVGLIAWIGVTLEHTHRRTRGLSRMPFGVDLKGDRDITRTQAEIEAVRSRTLGDTTGGTSPGTSRDPGRLVRLRRRDQRRGAGARHTCME